MLLVKWCASANIHVIQRVLSRWRRLVRSHVQCEQSQSRTRTSFCTPNLVSRYAEPLVWIGSAFLIRHINLTRAHLPLWLMACWSLGEEGKGEHIASHADDN